MKIDWDIVKGIAERYREQILSIPGVVGISTGVRRESGETQPCIRVYLNKTVERGNLKDQRIPWEIEEIPVDAVVTGDVIAFD